MNLDAPNTLVFDTLEQKMTDQSLAADALCSGQLVKAAPTGDGYYLIWPRGSAHDGAIRGLRRWLRGGDIEVERK